MIAWVECPSLTVKEEHAALVAAIYQFTNEHMHVSAPYEE